jgi:hypothetical protein
MHGFWLTLGYGLLALLALSVLVALVEFLRQGDQPAAAPQPLNSGAARRIDVDLDQLPAPAVALLPADGARVDADARRAAMHEVLNRLAQPAVDVPWVETTPMVLAPPEERQNSRGVAA